MIKDCGYFGDTNFIQELYVHTKRNRSILWEVKAQFVCLFFWGEGWFGPFFGEGGNLGPLTWGNRNDLIIGGGCGIQEKNLQRLAAQSALCTTILLISFL